MEKLEISSSNESASGKQVSIDLEEITLLSPSPYFLDIKKYLSSLFFKVL